MLRLFVGLEIPGVLKPEFDLISSGLPDARWIAPENLHLTLQFLGEVDEGVAEDIDASLMAVDSPSFDLTLQGTGCFETRNKVRAVWLDVVAESELNHLYVKIEQALIHAGLDLPQRKFKPHVTLARLKRVPAEAVVGYLENHAEFRRLQSIILPCFAVILAIMGRPMKHSPTIHSGTWLNSKIASYSLK